MANNTATVHTPQTVATVTRHVGFEETNVKEARCYTIAGF